MALLVAPLLVWLSRAVGPGPMAVVFTAAEVLAVVVTAVIAARIAPTASPTGWKEPCCRPFLLSSPWPSTSCRTWAHDGRHPASLPDSRPGRAATGPPPPQGRLCGRETTVGLGLSTRASRAVLRRRPAVERVGIAGRIGEAANLPDRPRGEACRIAPRSQDGAPTWNRAGAGCLWPLAVPCQVVVYEVIVRLACRLLTERQP